ncbi:MAG: hypothetical protein IJ677_07965 [Alphaproteobacteria bacterium]|nr:hypothetical protein [Alphaproteobacteria bacterium]
MSELFLDKDGKPYTGVVGGFDENNFGEKKEYIAGLLVHQEKREPGEDGRVHSISANYKYEDGKKYVKEQFVKLSSDAMKIDEIYDKKGFYDSENKFTGSIKSRVDDYGTMIFTSVETIFDKDTETGKIEEESVPGVYVHKVGKYTSSAPFKETESMIKTNGECFESRDGSVIHKWSQKNEQKDGLEQYFYKNGQLKYSLEWKEGQTSGFEKKFDEKGNVTEVNYFVNGCKQKYHGLEKMVAPKEDSAKENLAEKNKANKRSAKDQEHGIRGVVDRLRRLVNC